MDHHTIDLPSSDRVAGWSTRIALPIAVCLVFALSLAAPSPLHAQAFTITDVNPDTSALDASDPDGASGGRVNGLALASDGSTAFAATEWGGLYRSTDRGRTWHRLDGHLPTATWDVAVDPTDANRVYATSWYDGRVSSLAGINVSIDGGVTWTHPPSATPLEGFCLDAALRREPSAFGISIDPANPQNVFIGTNCGLAVSHDRGVTWRYLDPTSTQGADYVWDVVVHDGGIIDLVGADGHRRSTDGGLQWSTATSSPLPSGRGVLAISPDEPYVLFAVMGKRVYESDDGGASWPTELTNPNPQGRIPFVATNQRAGTGFDLWFGDVELHRATCTTPATLAPGGAPRCPTNTWRGPFTRTVGGHDDVGDLAFDPSTTSDACPLLFSSDGGVYYNTRTTTPTCHDPRWEQPDITPHALWLFGMGGVDRAGASEEELYFSNQDNGVFGTRAAGAARPTWVSPRCCDGFDIAANANRVLFTVCCFGVGRFNRLLVAAPGLTNVREISNYPEGDLPGFRHPDVVDQFGANHYVVLTTRGVFITQNFTANPIPWTQLGATTTPANGISVKVARTAGTPTFYLQTGNADGRSQDQLWRFRGTAPDGIWQRINPPGGMGGFGIFAVDPNNPQRLLASHLQNGVDPRMILSTDGGAQWTSLPALNNLMTGNGVFQYQNRRGPTRLLTFTGYPQPTLAAFDPHDANLLVAGGADAGVFISTDGGGAWRLITDPINGRPHLPRPYFAYFDHEPPAPPNVESINIFIGTQGRGVWRVEMTRVTREDCIPFDPQQATVSQVGERWKIGVGDLGLLDFGSMETEAQQALRILQHYGMNKQCFVGRPDAILDYYLVDDGAPTGAFSGEDCVGFTPATLTVEQIAGRWKIVEGSHWLLDFENREDEARIAFAILRQYEFTHLCFVGRPDASLTYLRR